MPKSLFLEDYGTGMIFTVFANGKLNYNSHLKLTKLLTLSAGRANPALFYFKILEY